MLDFGAVARLPERQLPSAMGTLIRIARDADVDQLVAGLREEGFIKDNVKVDPQLVLDYLVPLHRAGAGRALPLQPRVDARAVRADQQPARAAFTIATKLNLPT